jgi:hypothetical protein
MWRQSLLWPFVLIVYAAVMTYVTVRNGPKAGSPLLWLVFIPIMLVVLAALFYQKIRSSVHATESGIRVTTFRSSLMIPYDAVRSARAQKLQDLFPPERKKFITKFHKPHLDHLALFVRLRGEEQDVFGRRLGSRYFHDGVAAFAVPDAQTLAATIEGHLPKTGGGAGNMGGARRRRRPR